MFLFLPQSCPFLLPTTCSPRKHSKNSLSHLPLLLCLLLKHKWINALSQHFFFLSKQQMGLMKSLRYLTCFTWTTPENDAPGFTSSLPLITSLPSLTLSPPSLLQGFGTSAMTQLHTRLICWIGTLPPGDLTAAGVLTHLFLRPWKGFARNAPRALSLPPTGAEPSLDS